MKFSDYLLSTGGVIIVFLGLVVGSLAGVFCSGVTVYWQWVVVGTFLLIELVAFSVYIQTSKKTPKTKKGRD